MASARRLLANIAGASRRTHRGHKRNFAKVPIFIKNIAINSADWRWTRSQCSGTLGRLFNISWRTMMALSAHLAELSEKHKLLERRIEEEVTRPGSDDLEIHKLKLEKLKLKDEIVRLSGSETRH
jgi:hypothetical protein